MHKKLNQKLFIAILMFSLIITPAIAFNEDLSSLVGVQAFAYSMDEIENRDALESEMSEEYSRIFSFVSQSAIDVDSQKQIIDSGNMAGNDSISSLAIEITASCESDSQKAWALYQWMTNNIYRDTAAESDGSQSKLSSADVFESKYATAEGFSNLYVTLCRFAGVPCRKIEGLYIDSTLSYDDALAKYLNGKANHCWNEVYVNGQWKAVDVYLDCANSYTDTVFTKSDSSDFWYSADFSDFAKSHMGMTYDESFGDDKFTYTVSMNKITASNYVGKETDITIPNGVNIVGEMANTNITGVTFPESGVTEIGNKAFYKCANLKSIVIPQSVTVIGNLAFSGCSALSEVVLPDNLEKAGTTLFSNCTSLESITIPKTLDKLRSNTFTGCTALSQVTIEDGVNTIENLAFKNCTALESIVIPNSVNKISSSVFYGCKNLKSVVLPDDITTIAASTFEKCSSLESITIPSAVTSIGNYAFRDCTALSEIDVPDTVTSIGTSAFEGCTNLQSIRLKGISIVPSKAFYGCTALETVNLGISATEVAASAFENCTALKRFIGAAEITSVRESAFSGCTSLMSIPFWNNITLLEKCAFKNCEKITNITLNLSGGKVPEEAFYGCKALTSVSLSENIKHIGSMAFYGCAALAEIDLPIGLLTIGDSAFASCTALENIGSNLPAGLTEIGGSAFKSTKVTCNGNLTIPKSIKTIKANAFSYIDEIKTLVLTSNVTTIEARAFRNDKITDIYYLGTEEQWANISIGTFNNCFTSATIHHLGSNHYHAFGKETLSKPTCSEYGLVRFTCNCTYAYVEKLKKSPHTESVIRGKAATCTYGGYTEGVGCSVCGAIIVKREAIPKLDHTKSDWITDTAATCTSVGSKHIECTVCHTTIETGTIDKLPHTETTIDAVVATCTSTGLSEGKKCKVCGDIIVAQTTTPKVNHTKSDTWITDTAATCKKEGSKHIECTICHATLETGTIGKLPHTETTIDAVAATCTSTGLSEGKKCKVCGDIIVEPTTTPKVSHTKSDWITDTSATCKKEGSKHIECTVCHTTLETGTIDKLPHTETTIDAVAATCTSTGLSEGKECSVCGDIIVAQTTTPKVNHTKGDWITDTSATCKKEGSKHIECTICHATLETGTIDKLPHTETTIDAVAATCTSTGLSEGKECSVCGDIIVAQTTTPKVNHTKGDTWITDTSATCKKEGSKHIECTICHVTLETGTIDKLPHTETTIDAVAATCTSTGLSEGKKCKVCGDIIVAQTTTPKVNHTKGDTWITDTAATCKKEGSKHIECTVCLATIETGTIDKLPHTETTIDAVAATCTSTGLSEGKKCSVCGDIIVAQTTTPKVSHTKGDTWITDTAATCKKEGSKHIECTICHATLETGTIDKLPHTETTIDAVAATCTSTGLSEGKKCKVCGDIIVEPTTTPKVNHTKSDWINDTNATCKKEGSKHIECTICHATIETGTIDKLPHTETTIDAVAATCTSTGLSEGKECSVCGDIIVAQTTTPKVSHTKSDWKTDTNATCKKEGSKHIECTICHATLETGTIGKVPHCETTMSSIAATCNSTGMTQGKKCSECGEIIEAQKVTPKLAHKMSGFSVVKRPTCTESGLERSTCQNCDHVEIRNIAATGHNYQGSVCANCGDNRSRNCSCNCHKSGFMGFIWKIICFFYKLFGTNQVCSCGAMHY